MKHKRNRRLYQLIAVLFWVLLWQLLSMYLDQTLFLPSPFDTIYRLIQLAGTYNFWLTILYSVLRIGAGFVLAIFIGVALAVMTWRFVMTREIITLAMRVVKSIPVVSFIILALLWVKSENLSTLISFLMVLPIIYINVITGIDTTNSKLLEMAEIFEVPTLRRVRYIYLPAVIPYFVSACSVSLGFCWKSGIAAEVIGIVEHSIGGELYNAKLYLAIPDLFAWTIVIVIISAVFEYLIMKGIRWVEYKSKEYREHD